MRGDAPPRWIGPLAVLGVGTRFHYGWAIVGACWLTFATVYGSLFYSYPVFFVQWEGEFHWSRGFIAGVHTLVNLTAAAFAPGVGRLVDAVGARRLILTGALLVGGGLLLLSRMSQGWHLYAVYLMVALGFSTTNMLPLSTLVARWFQRRRGLALGLAHSGMGAGGMVMVQVTRLLAEAFGWRTAAMVLGLIVWGVVVPLMLLVVRSRPEDVGLRPYGAPVTDAPSSPPTAPRAPSAEEQGLTLGQVSRTWRFWALALIFLAGAIATTGLFGHLLPFMTDLKFSLAAGSLAITLAAVFHLSGKILFGFAGDRVPSRVSIALAFSFGSVAALLFLSAYFGVGRAIVFVGVPLMGVSSAAVTVILPTIVVTHFGSRHMGSIMGVLMSFTTGGFAAGPLISGLLFDATGSYRLSFSLFTGLFALAIAATWLLRPVPKVTSRLL